MEPQRTKAAECQACSDSCSRALSTFCDEPVQIMSYVEKMDKPFMTVHPTAPYYQDDTECAKAKETCTDMFVEKCDNAYRVVSGASCCGRSTPSIKAPPSAQSYAHVSSPLFASGVGHVSPLTAGAFLGPVSASGFESVGAAPPMFACPNYFEFAPSYSQQFQEKAFAGLYQ